MSFPTFPLDLFELFLLSNCSRDLLSPLDDLFVVVVVGDEVVGLGVVALDAHLCEQLGQLEQAIALLSLARGLHVVGGHTLVVGILTPLVVAEIDVTDLLVVLDDGFDDDSLLLVQILDVMFCF